MSEVKQRRSGKAAGAAGMAEASQGPVTKPADAKSGAEPAETLRDRELNGMKANGAGVLAIMFAFAEASETDKRLPMLAQAAKLFLIAVIFIAPVLLMWQHAF